MEMMDMKAKLKYRSQDIIGEGVLWHPSLNRLYWVDIEGCLLHELFPLSGEVVDHRMPAMVSTIVPDRDSGLILTLKGSISHYNPQSGILTYLTDVELDVESNRCNDGKCDPDGRLWFGTMSLNADKGAGALYVYDGNEEPLLKLSQQTIPNGIVWSNDGSTMYYIDTATRSVDEYRYDSVSGEIYFLRKAIVVPEMLGYPDGMAIDEEGMLWIAHWGGYGVYRWNPISGVLLQKIAVPVPNVASCAFGGDSYHTLFISTARSGLSGYELSKYPLSGSLFECELTVAGRAANRFSGSP